MLSIRLKFHFYPNINLNTDKKRLCEAWEKGRLETLKNMNISLGIFFCNCEKREKLCWYEFGVLTMFIVSENTLKLDFGTRK